MNLFMFGIIIMAFVMITAKRIGSLITAFSLQSFFLFLLTFTAAVTEQNIELYIVASLILIIKVALAPFFLRRIVRKIGVSENLGLILNPLLSLAAALILTYASYLLARKVMPPQSAFVNPLALSLSVILTGLLLMVIRLKAVSQIIGLLVMENGTFLAAVVLCGSMPFLIEITIFFDIFMLVIILGIFVYKINQLFTHIDVDKLKVLKG